MQGKREASAYEQLRDVMAAGDILRRLGVEIVREQGSEIYLNPICHQSQSGEALQVNTHTGRWNCKACQSSGVKGDLIGLVEYYQTNGCAPTTEGQSHVDAVKWLCDHYGIVWNSAGSFYPPVLDAVHWFSMEAHDALLDDDEMMAWVESKWGFDRETVVAYGIGFMPSPLPKRVEEELAGPNKDTHIAAGLGHPKKGGFNSPFEGRVTFPYFGSDGHAVYLIGRSTSYTPSFGDGHAPKYHKLPVRKQGREYVSPLIENHHLYNEGVLRGDSSVIVVAEGVADAVALSSLGVPVVSPVTISFNADDIERFANKVLDRETARVEILFDNELSGAGQAGAVRTGVALMERGIPCRILEVPPLERQQAAIDEIREAMGAESFEEMQRAEPAARKRYVTEGFSEDQAKWIISQFEEAKIDVAEWVAETGAGAAGKFAAVQRKGRDVIDLMLDAVVDDIDRLRDSVDADDYEPSDEDVLQLGSLRDVARLAAHISGSLHEGIYVGLMSKRLGMNKGPLRDLIKQARRKLREAGRGETKKAKQKDHAETIEQALADAMPPPDPRFGGVAGPPQPAAPAPPPPAPGGPPAPKAGPPTPKIPGDYERFEAFRSRVHQLMEDKTDTVLVAKLVMRAIKEAASYSVFAFSDGRNIALVRGNEVHVGSIDKLSDDLRAPISIISGLYGMTTTERRYLAAVREALQREAHATADTIYWGDVNKDEGRVSFALGGDVGAVADITAEGVDVAPINKHHRPVGRAHNFRPVVYTQEDGAIPKVEKLMEMHSIARPDAMMLMSFVGVLPLMTYIGKAPIIRFEGGSSSGKTRLVQSISSLVLGTPTPTVPTDAALVSLLSRSLVVFDDNREAHQISSGLEASLIQASNLGTREKRSGNTNTRTTNEVFRSALVTNGIEPITSGKVELSSRMMVIRCSERYRREGSDSHDLGVAHRFGQLRDGFWSESLRRCSFVLKHYDEHRDWIEPAINKITEKSRQGRLAPYYAACVLWWLAGQPEANRAAVFEERELPDRWRDVFVDRAIESVQSISPDALAVSAMHYAFTFLRMSLAEQESKTLGADEVSLQTQPFTLCVSGRDRGLAVLGELGARQLAGIVRAAAGAMNGPKDIRFGMTSGTLAARLLDSTALLEEEGFEMEHRETSRGRSRFTLRFRFSGELVDQVVEALPNSALPPGANSRSATDPPTPPNHAETASGGSESDVPF